MARRLTTRQADNVKDCIKTSLILKKLQDHIVNPELTPLSNTQRAAADILLRKVLPDLRATEHSAGDGASVGVQFVIKQ